MGDRRSPRRRGRPARAAACSTSAAGQVAWPWPSPSGAPGSGASIRPRRCWPGPRGSGPAGRAQAGAGRGAPLQGRVVRPSRPPARRPPPGPRARLPGVPPRARAGRACRRGHLHPEPLRVVLADRDLPGGGGARPRPLPDAGDARGGARGRRIRLRPRRPRSASGADSAASRRWSGSGAVTSRRCACWTTRRSLPASPGPSATSRTSSTRLSSGRSSWPTSPALGRRASSPPSRPARRASSAGRARRRSRPPRSSIPASSSSWTPSGRAASLHRAPLTRSREAGKE